MGMDDFNVNGFGYICVGHFVKFDVFFKQTEVYSAVGYCCSSSLAVYYNIVYV